MAVQVQNPVLLTDGDAAFLRVDSGRPAHALEPGVVAGATNCRFERGKVWPRLGVAVEAWGMYGSLITSFDWSVNTPNVYQNLADDWHFVVTGLLAGRQYRLILGNADVLTTSRTDLGGGDYYRAGTEITSGTFTATQTTYYLWCYNASVLAVSCTTHLFQVANACAYKRFNDPGTGTDNAVLITDDWRDGAGEDGGRGRAWRILPGNTPAEISLNGHDVWSTARLVQCQNAMLLLRHGNQRYYFSAAAVAESPDRITLNVTPPWPLNTARRVLYEMAKENSGIFDPAARTLSITDTETATDTITIVGHALLTGDEVTITGLTGVTLGTVYFARSVTADTISIHPTLSDAQANTNRINLTDDETGTLSTLAPNAPAPGNYYYAKHVAGNKVELYSNVALTNQMRWRLTPVAPVGAFYLEVAQTPEPWYGNDARCLILQPNAAGNTAFETGFVSVTDQVAITGTTAASNLITAPNHRLQPGQSVTGSFLTGVAWPAFAAPQSGHTLRLYLTADEAMIDAYRTLIITDTETATDTITIPSHDLLTGDKVRITGLTGVTATTDYFARYVTADTISIHPLLADAKANTNAINLTADETGTLYAQAGIVDLTVDNEVGTIWRTDSSSVPLPGCREGAYLYGRFIGIHGRDTVVISDPLDFLHCTLFQAALPANVGDSGYARWIAPLGENVVAVGKDHCIVGIAGLAGSASGWSERIITAQYNGTSPLAALQLGSDVVFASRRGLASVVRTLAGETLGVVRTLSHPIADELLDIDWGQATLMCAETWQSRLFWAVPMKGQDTPVNNKVLVLNFENQTLYLDQSVVNGGLVGAVREYDAGSVRPDAWEGEWTGDLLQPYAWARLTIAGEERLTYVTADGLVCWLHDGWDDAGAEIQTELITRGYFGGREMLALRGNLNVDTFRPSVSAYVRTAGVHEETALAGFSALTYDRTKYTVDGQADYDPSTSTSTSWALPHRQDYSPAPEELLVAELDTHQNFNEPFRCRERGVAPQLRIVNTQGSLRIGMVQMDAKPVGVSAKRKS